MRPTLLLAWSLAPAAAHAQGIDLTLVQGTGPTTVVQGAPVTFTLQVTNHLAAAEEF